MNVNNLIEALEKLTPEERELQVKSQFADLGFADITSVDVCLAAAPFEPSYESAPQSAFVLLDCEL